MIAGHFAIGAVIEIGAGSGDSKVFVLFLSQDEGVVYSGTEAAGHDDTGIFN